MRKIRWGVIGCSGIADRRTIPGLLLTENSELVAVMGTDPERTERVRGKYSAARAYTDEKELLMQPDIDAVYIASPVFCHKAQVFSAADAGKHILLEKPMGLTAQEAQEMMEYCASKGVKLGIGFMMRFHGAHQRIKEEIVNGTIGEVVSAYAKFNCWSPVSSAKWRQTKAFSGGGAMMDMGIHCVDLLQYLTDLQAKEVVGLSGNQIFAYPDTEDAATAVMRMENGALFTVEANFNIPDPIGGCKFEIYGTKGCISAQGTIGQTETGTVTLTCCEADHVISKALDYTSGNLYTQEIEAFSQAILEDLNVPVTAQQAILDQKIIEAVYESQKSGRRIYLI